MLSRRHFPLAALLVAVLLVYSNSFSNAFHFDDFHTITDNPAVRSLGNLHRIFTDTTAFSVLPANQTYRPVVTASLALDYAMGRGYVPFWFHLSALIWFEVLVASLYLLLRQVLDRVQHSGANRWLALGIAAWFGLHPAMAETVNYVIQRGDLYCTLGCVASLLIYARLESLRRYGVYLLPFVLAMLSKPPAAVLPLLLFLYVFFFEAEELPLARRWRNSALAVVPTIAVTIVLLWLQSAMTPKSFAPSIVSPVAYRLTQPYVWLRYTNSLLLPLHLNVDTDLQPFATLDGRAVGGLLFFLGLMTLIAWAARRPRLYPVAFGLLWFVITQLPTSLYPLSEVENDHRMFFSFPGLMLAVVWALALAYDHLRLHLPNNPQQSLWARFALTTLSLLALSGYAYGAHKRNAIWRSEDSLWADDVAKSPHNGRGLMIYGLTRLNVGDYPAALALFNRASQYTPNYATLEINLGTVNGLLAASGHPTLTPVAEAHFQRAITLAPGDDTTHSYYGRWLLNQGLEPEATAQLRTAVSLNPQRAMQRDLLLNAYQQAGDLRAAQRLAQETLAIIPGDANALAVLHAQAQGSPVNQAASLINASLSAYREGQYELAVENARQALAIQPGSAQAWNNLGAGYGGLHEWNLGIAAERQALSLDPNLQIARNNLNWFLGQANGKSQALRYPPSRSVADYINLSLKLSQQGRFQESIVAARQALTLDSSSAEAWNNIAAGEASLHQWDEAINAAQKAITLQPNFQLARNNLAWAMQQKAASARP